MALRSAVALLLLAGAAAFQHANLRRSPESVADGEIPTAGEAVGQQAGVDVPNPHQYTGAIFCVASYFCYKWNSDMTEKGQEPYCGIMSAVCCCCCTPLVCCFPIDAAKDGK